MRIRWLRGTTHPRRKGQIEDCAKSGATPDLVEIWVAKGWCEIVPDPKPEPPMEKTVEGKPKVRTRAISKAPETKD